MAHSALTISSLRLWLVIPLVAACGTAMLLWYLPPAGPLIEIRWHETVTPERRQSLERRLGLANPNNVRDTTWAYVVDDVSRGNVQELISTPELVVTQFMAGEPYAPRLTGPVIVRLAGPFSVQSLVCLLVGCLSFAGSYAPRIGLRKLYVTTACLLLMISWVRAELPIRAGYDAGVWMGDYETYTESRQNFRENFGYEAVRFHFHLGGFLLNAIDRALGATDASTEAAFLYASWLMGVVFLFEAACIAALYRWSARVMRYLSLAVAAPLSLSFFGYRELGYYALSIGVFPLFMYGVMSKGEATRLTCVAGAAVVQGVRSALHGFGLVALGGLFVASLATGRSLRSRVAQGVTVLLWGTTAYLGWLLAYLLLLGLPVVPGHATGVPLRLLFEPYVAEHRLVEPILSDKGLWDLSLESVIVGLPVFALGVIASRGTEEQRHALAFAVSSVAFLLLFWPAQGIGVDMDGVFAAFPAVFAGAWLCARSARTTAAGLALFALAHAAFWFVVRNPEFTNPRV